MLPPRLTDPIVALRRVTLLPPWLRRLDVAVGRRINARHAHPAVDRGYARLSRAADRGVLWFSIAAVLVVVRSRRAGLRGVASLTVASILANLVGKKLFGGERPLLKDVPVGRHLKKSPTSPSFPSGHSASAAAFATGVALESPRAALAIGPVAGGVAYSRLHTGAHWFSDVVGGIAIGMAVALLGKVLVPARRTPKRAARSGGTDIALPAAPDGEGVFFVLNPSSGQAVSRPDPAPLIAQRLPRARVHQLDEGEDLAVTVRAAVASARPPRVLGVCGGDGTVAVVAHSAREARLPLLVLPGGTFNHFARTAGVETFDDAIDALQTGEGVRVDVAELTFGDAAPVTVLNAAAVGIYPDFVAEREKLERRLDKRVAALLAAVRVLRTADPVEVTVDGRPTRLWSLFAGVNRNYPYTVAPLQRRRLDDGLLDVRVLHAGTTWHAVALLSIGRHTSAVLRRLRLLPGPAVLEAFTEDALTVVVRPRQGQPPGFAHDGEVAPGVPDAPTGEAPEGGYVSTLRIVPGGLDVYSPRPAR